MNTNKSLLTQANEAYRNKDFDNALRLYLSAQKLYPELKNIIDKNIELTRKYLALSAPRNNVLKQASIDIVVPVFNALEDVKKCLASLSESTDGFNVKIIVVNDGSDEPTTLWLREFCNKKAICNLIENPKNLGYTKTVNVGLKASNADYVITQNSDTIVSNGWLTGLINCMQSDSKIGICGPLSNAATWQNVPYLYDDSGKQHAVNDLPPGFTVAKMAEVVSKASVKLYPRLPFVNGFCFMIKREVINKIGYMDEENFPVGYGEENDYCIRALDAGFELAIADDIYVYHAKSKSFGHEKRIELSNKGTESLKRKYTTEKYTDLLSKVKNTATLDVIRVRINNALISKRLSHDVIVCVHNAPDDVDACINSILKYKDCVDNIIVIDDFSDPVTVQLLNKYSNTYPEIIKVVRTAHQSGYTKAANLGLHQSQADIRTLLNSDTIVTKGWAKKILARFAENTVIGIVGPLSNAASHQSVPSAIASATQTAINGLPKGISPDDINAFCEQASVGLEAPFTPLVHGFCMSISAQCLDAVGYFDEQAFPRGYGEENDFCIRAQDAGYALVVSLDTYIFHAKSKSYSSEHRVKLMNEGWAALVSKHGKERLQHAIKTMETHPQFLYMRQQVENKFYRPSIIDSHIKSEVSRKAEFGYDDKLKTIAFYLPQFHPTPENDKNWGEGFTEWTNVVKARPRFPDHYQPRLPGKLGFYDLRLPQIMKEQTDIANDYGLSGFCFYYYRFGTKRVLDYPLQKYLKYKEAQLPFCYCWANESWTRAWDGKTSEVLFQQDYDDTTLSGYVADIAEAITDERYIRIKGRPVVLIYQVAELPEPELTIKDIRNRLKVASGEDVLIGSVFSHNFKVEMLDFLDFVVQFPPHRMPRDGARVTIPRQQMNPFEPERHDYYEAYDEVIKGALKGPDLINKMLLGACPDWDNTSRREKNATTIVGSTPEKFSEWVNEAAVITRQKFKEGHIPAPVMFINAWNEWAEGAVLEPTEKYGYQYLEAFRRALE